MLTDPAVVSPLASKLNVPRIPSVILARRRWETTDGLVPFDAAIALSRTSAAWALVTDQNWTGRPIAFPNAATNCRPTAGRRLLGTSVTLTYMPSAAGPVRCTRRGKIENASGA